MNRMRRATIVASFSYLQYALAIASGILMVPLTLHYLGPRRYGLWLASGELLGYAAMIDLGVIGVLPWLLAEAGGRGDRDGMRRLVANGFVVGLVVALGCAALAALSWVLLPAFLVLDPVDAAAMALPLALLAGTLAVTYPFRVFGAVLAGLQDATFNGWLAVGQSLVAIGLTAGLLLAGFGLYALAVASAAAAMVTAIGATIRVRMLAPDLLRGWPRPTAAGVRTLLANGLGVWGGTFGWQLVAASNGLVITSLGRPEWIAVYACTSKLIGIATQLTWVIPDAGLVGLAQVQGESPGPERLRPLTLLMLRLHLLLAGGAACTLLVFNPPFVRQWVGDALFGGVTLNLLLAAGLVTACLVHGVLASASVIGNRLRVGGITLIQGLLQLACASMLGRAWGLPGIAAAVLVSGLVVSLPAGVRLLTPATGLAFSHLWQELLAPWARRAWGPLVAGALLSVVMTDASWSLAVTVTAGLGVVYLLQVRPLLADLPLASGPGRWLVRLRLVPAAAGAAVAATGGPSRQAAPSTIARTAAGQA